MSSGPREVRASRGPVLSCKGWGQEAALRLLMNNLDPEVAEHPESLVGNLPFKPGDYLVMAKGERPHLRATARLRVVEPRSDRVGG